MTRQKKDIGSDREMDYKIRKVLPEDLDEVVFVESVCFPPAEAAGRSELEERIQGFPDSFFVAETDGRIIGFINGAATDSSVITDEMFETIHLHNPDGAYQSIFGLDVLPEYRGRGIASALMKQLIEAAREDGRRGLILTCKDRLLPYYERFGYRNRGISASVHGGAVWYDMILEF